MLRTWHIIFLILITHYDVEISRDRISQKKELTLVVVVVELLSHVRLFATPWTVAYQAPLSKGFSRQEYWSGLPCPLPGTDLWLLLNSEYSASPERFCRHLSPLSWRQEQKRPYRARLEPNPYISIQSLFLQVTLFSRRAIGNAHLNSLKREISPSKRTDGEISAVDHHS